MQSQFDTSGGRSPAAGKAPRGKLTVIYDGRCARCRRAAAAIRARCDTGQLELLDLNEPRTAGRFPNLPPAQMESELHAVDDAGRVWRGAGAIRQVLLCERGPLRHAALFWKLPGFSTLADRIYRGVAASRRRDPA